MPEAQLLIPSHYRVISIYVNTKKNWEVNLKKFKMVYKL